MAWDDNFIIFFENVSIYYIWSLIISFLSVFLSIYMHFYTKSSDNQEAELVNLIENENEINISKIKVARQQVLVEKLTAELTAEQILQEQEVQAQQLNAILKLLKEQQEKFKVGTMEEVEDQLKLYR